MLREYCDLYFENIERYRLSKFNQGTNCENTHFHILYFYYSVCFFILLCINLVNVNTIVETNSETKTE